ncbi:hypothetical protein D3C76_1807940 [compost metagenome]
MPASAAIQASCLAMEAMPEGMMRMALPTVNNVVKIVVCLAETREGFGIRVTPSLFIGSNRSMTATR